MTSPNNRQPPLRTRAAFTPPSRTPWGGTRIAARYGRQLGLTEGAQVGEAWVFSLDPAFPSVVGNAPLAELVQSTLLVKLLDAAAPLSVQIHPSDDYAGLAPEQSGKPEAWYVLERDPGAGLFLGFLPGVAEAQVRRALQRGDDLSQLMHFVPVEPGDFFVIDAGTPHAIGAGVTLVEPQRVLPGWAGVTYRYWDWNRRYDTEGKPSPAGAPRDLHVEHALAVTDWDRVTRAGFVDSVRLRAGAAPTHVAASAQPLTRARDDVHRSSDGSAATRAQGAGGRPPPCHDLFVARLVGSGPLALPRWASLGAAALCVLEGAVTTAHGERFEAGETAAVEAHGQPLTLHQAHALLMAARPAQPLVDDAGSRAG
jgi:mannose-6-phosphate isomerase